MNTLSISSNEFAAATSDRLQGGACLVVVRWPNMAGARDYYLIVESRELDEVTSELPAGTSVLLVFSVSHIVSGEINSAFIAHVGSKTTEGEVYLVVYAKPRNDWRKAAEYRSWLCTGRELLGASELIDELNQNIGETATVMRYPDLEDDGNQILRGLVPDAEGRLTPGAY